MATTDEKVKQQIKANVMKIHDIIAPRLAALALQTKDVPAGFTPESLETTVATWARRFAGLLVLPDDLDRALTTMEVTATRFPTFPDLMAAMYGDDWAEKKLSFPVPKLLWEDVLDLATGKVVETYPYICPGAKMMTRLDIERDGVPDWDIEMRRIGLYLKAGGAELWRKERSAYLGYDVKLGAPSVGKRRPHIRGDVSLG